MKHLLLLGLLATPVGAECITPISTDTPYGIGPYGYSWSAIYDGFFGVGELNEIQWTSFCHDRKQYFAVYYGAEGPESFYSAVLLFAELTPEPPGPNLEVIGQIELRGVSAVGLLWDGEQVKLDQSHTGYPPLPLWDFHEGLTRLYW